MLTPQVYKSAEAADLVDAYIEIGEEDVSGWGVRHGERVEPFVFAKRVCKFLRRGYGRSER